MTHLNKELFSLILIVTSGIITLAFAIGIVYLIDTVLGVPYGLGYIIAYMLICIGLYIVGKLKKNRILIQLHRIAILPFTLFIGFLSVAIPYFVLQINLFVYLFFSSIIPILLYRLDRTVGILDLKITTHIYLIVTFSVITATLLNKQMKYLTYKCSPMQLYNTHILRRFDFNRLTDYLLSEHTIKFIIYFLYFIYLLVFNLFTFEENSLYSTPLMDRAVLQSFITFLALERLIANLKDLNFKPSEMLKLLLTSISGTEKRDQQKGQASGEN